MRYVPGCDAVECNNTDAFPPGALSCSFYTVFNTVFCCFHCCCLCCEYPALAAAKEADAIVVLFGLHYDAAGNATQCDRPKPWITDIACEGEGIDRQFIKLPGNTTAFIAALRKAAPNTPLIGVIIHGGALALGTAAEDLDAVVVRRSILHLCDNTFSISHRFL